MRPLGVFLGGRKGSPERVAKTLYNRLLANLSSKKGFPGSLPGLPFPVLLGFYVVS
jgi:hypothetical protein